MNHIHRIRRAIRLLTVLASALLTCGAATPALAASLRPPPGSLQSPPAPPPPTRIHTVVTGGMPGWQITLIAVGAALAAAIVAVLLDRARAARRGDAVKPA
jgi:hypothetical protein